LPKKWTTQHRAPPQDSAPSALLGAVPPLVALLRGKTLLAQEQAMLAMSISLHTCGWLRNPAPVENGDLSIVYPMNYRGFTILLVVQDFATICNHPQYVGMGENPSKPTITIWVFP